MENLNAQELLIDLENFYNNFKATYINHLRLGAAISFIKSQEHEIEALHRLISEKIQEKVMLTAENKKIGIENFDLVCQLSRIKADTVENRETVQRALDILEGVAYGASQRVQDAIYNAIETIDTVLANEEREAEDEKEKGF